MKKNTWLPVCLSVVLMISGILAVPSLQAEEPGKAQTLCPIMGGPIDKTAYADYEGKRVYFCCAGCKSEFLKDPKKHIQKMESQGIVLETVPAGKKDSGHHEEKHHGSDTHS
jgi:YHS domain-containing protein